MPQLPITNFFIDQGDRYIGEKDANNTNVVPSLQYILVNGVFVPVSVANPMPATVSNFPATQPVSGAVTANIGTTNGLALDGTDTTGVTPPAGATGIRGWLSAIYNLFFGGTAKVQASITGSTLTSATALWTQSAGRKILVQQSKASYTAAVAASASSIITITPTAGYIGRVKSVSGYVPAIAGSTGSHGLFAYVGAALGYTAERIINSEPTGVTAISLLAADQATQVPLKDVPFSVANPLYVQYLNSTNSSQAGTRFIQIIWEEEAITP